MEGLEGGRGANTSSGSHDEDWRTSCHLYGFCEEQRGGVGRQTGRKEMVLGERETKEDRGKEGKEEGITWRSKK